MGFIKDIENEFNASNNNTTEKYNNNELFSLTTIDSKEGFDVKNDVKKVKKTLNKNKTSIFQFIFTLFGGIISQLFFRIYKFNGSLDRWWMLLPIFWFPPLSIIPAYYISRNKIKQGDSKLEFFDLKTIIAFSGVFIALLLRIFTRDVTVNIISQIIPLVSLFIAYYMRDCKRCIDDTGNRKKQISKAGFSSILALSISIIMHLTMKIIYLSMPGINDFLKPIYKSDVLTSAIFGFNVYLSYLIVNCLNNTSSEFKYCKSRNFRKQYLPVILIGLISLFAKGLI